MKIVLISKSYFPIQSARALRTTELAQQFARMGHDVTVYTVAGQENYEQYTVKTGVKVRLVRTHWIPSARPKSRLKTFFIRGFAFLFGRLIEFPNIELIWRVKEILAKEKEVDLLVTIALPYPIHWGAAFAKKRFKETFPKTWVSDCGDPYMGNDVYRPFFYFKYLEKFWGDQTDYVTIPIKEASPAYYNNVQKKIRVIPQGFDFSTIRLKADFVGNEIPTFAYTGTIFPGYRDLMSFLEYLCAVETDFRFYVYTKTPDTIMAFKDKLKKKLIISDYIPRHDLIYQLSQMDFLINLTNQSTVQSPSKLIDYGLTKRPILDVSTPFKEFDAFNAFISRDYSMQHPSIDVEQYDIARIAEQFIALTKDDQL